MIIVGAGLAGLIAAHAWPQARIIESSAEPKAEHKALLRFRSDAVARLTGTDFRRVTVRKGIWFQGEFVPPSIRAANMYAQKVTGSLSGERSIWNLEPVERFIAPESIYEELLANVGARITWGEEFDFKRWSEGNDRRIPVINTAPLSLLAQALGINDEACVFKRAPIAVQRYRVPGADAFQTVYFPDPAVPVYRASITGSLLIVESIPMKGGAIVDQIWHMREAFGLDRSAKIEFLDAVEQKYGKIIPLPDGQRRALLHRLTTQHGIFSLGRFATWRNILLDDVVQDIAVLRRLMKASNYERAIFATTN